MAGIAMQFLLDNNVPDSVALLLRESGHVVRLVREILLPDSPDPLVATVSEKNGWILVSSDHDFDRISPRIPRGSKKRFKRLSRVSLRCSEYQAAERLKRCMPHILLAHAAAQESGNPMRIVVQNDGLKIIG